MSLQNAFMGFIWSASAPYVAGRKPQQGETRDYQDHRYNRSDHFLRVVQTTTPIKKGCRLPRATTKRRLRLGTTILRPHSCASILAYRVRDRMILSYGPQQAALTSRGRPMGEARP